MKITTLEVLLTAFFPFYVERFDKAVEQGDGLVKSSYETVKENSFKFLALFVASSYVLEKTVTAQGGIDIAKGVSATAACAFLLYKQIRDCYGSAEFFTSRIRT